MDTAMASIEQNCEKSTIKDLQELACDVLHGHPMCQFDFESKETSAGP